jgi:hypothetical protein
MTPEQQAEINLHLQAIASILYQECDPSQLDNLAVIEETIRQQTLEYITPQIGFFLFKNSQKLNLEDSGTSKALLGNYQLQKNKLLA